MFDMEEKRRDEDRQRSEAIMHFQGEEDRTLEKPPEAYKPHWSERGEAERPRELFAMGNSYGQISFAANRKKEMLLAVSRKRRHNSESIENDQKRLKGKRRRAVVNPIGQTYTNSFDPINSAFALKTGKAQPSKRVLAYINKYVEKNGQNEVEEMLPFLSLERDRKERQELTSARDSADKKAKDAVLLEQAKGELSQAITQKEQMQSRFLKKMEFALRKASLVVDEKAAAWLNAGASAVAMSSPDGIPEAEEEAPETDPGEILPPPEKGKA